MRYLFIGFLMVIPALAASIDLDSYCSGWCRNRYADGYNQGSSCACVDFYPINLKNVIQAPKKAKKDPQPPAIYYGVDSMSYPSPDAENENSIHY